MLLELFLGCLAFAVLVAVVGYLIEANPGRRVLRILSGVCGIGFLICIIGWFILSVGPEGIARLSLAR